MPTALLQGSLLLGGATRWVLGPGGQAAATAAGSAAASTIAVHPFVIGGWCGLVATALNCLPVGCLDGGRIMQVRAHVHTNALIMHGCSFFGHAIGSCLNHHAGHRKRVCPQRKQASPWNGLHSHQTRALPPLPLTM